MATQRVILGALIFLVGFLAMNFVSAECNPVDCAYSRDIVYFTTYNASANNQTNTTSNVYINILSPEASEKCGKYVWLEIDSNATENGGVVWYEYDGKKEIYTDEVELYFKSGWHTLTAYANDSYGNVVSDSVRFNVKKSSSKDDDDDEKEKTYDDPIYTVNNSAKVSYNKGIIVLENFEEGEEATPWYIVLFNSGVVLLFFLLLVFITLVLISVYWYKN